MRTPFIRLRSSSSLFDEWICFVAELISPSFRANSCCGARYLSKFIGWLLDLHVSISESSISFWAFPAGDLDGGKNGAK